MKFYKTPEIEVVAITTADILNGSDTIVDIGDLYGDGGLSGEAGGPSMVSEYTGEPIEW